MKTLLGRRRDVTQQGKRFATCEIVAIVCIFLLPVWCQQSAPADNPLTNDAVIRLVQGGLSPDVVAEKVRATRNRNFNTEPEELLRLKAANVPDSVILAMVEPPPDFLQSRAQLLISAKRVYLRNESKDEEVFNALRKKISKWGRWQIVDKSEQADIVLVFATNTKWMATVGGGGLGLGLSLPAILTAIHPVTGVPLVSVSTEQYITAGWTAHRLVDRMREQVEGLTAPPMPGQPVLTTTVPPKTP